MKRLLNCYASDLKKLKGKEVLESIRASEGRTIISEVGSPYQSLYSDISNPEIASTFGSDFLLLNLFDVNNPFINGIDASGDKVIERLKELTGRLIGVNLEPVDINAEMLESLDDLPSGRIATDESLKKAKELGIDFVCLTGNPKTGVTNQEILEAVHRAEKVYGEEGFIIAGKMHGAGVKGEGGNDIIDDETIEKFISAGADVILLPSPGTVPGVTLEGAHQWVSTTHKHGALAMLCIGTSQEGADVSTIRDIALQNKMAGADIHHIGDAGYTGIAVPENIMEYSIAIRGKRLTYFRMAGSINR